MTVSQRARRTNERGYPIGESHHAARSSNWLADRIVAEMRRLHEEEGWGLKRLAHVYSISVDTARNIIYYRRRGQVARLFLKAGEQAKGARSDEG